jgi:hypothetical protein
MHTLVIFIIILVIIIIGYIYSIKTQNKEISIQLSKYIQLYSEADKNYKELKSNIDAHYANLDTEKNKLNIYEEKLNKKNAELEIKLQTYKEEVSSNIVNTYHNILERRLPYLSNLIAELKTLPIDWTTKELQNSESIRKWQRAEKINDLKSEIKFLLKENYSLKGQLEYFKYIYPETSDDLEVDYENTEHQTEYLTKEEYNSLTDTERNKLALLRYKNRKKSKVEIGRDFERYIGYLCEKQNYNVTYSGIKEGLKDKGRDLIIENATEICVIQCKYWSKNKTIHEKHLCQLYGTTIMYGIEINTTKKIKPIFVCHNDLSTDALKFAEKLGISVYKNVELKEYPLIKLNLNTKEKIYHLPIDQQYDNTYKNIKYVSTIDEAEALGYRRAYKWCGE